MDAERFPPLRLVPIQEGPGRVYHAQLNPNPRTRKEEPQRPQEPNGRPQALKRTLEFLRENHRKYYVLYRLMPESGLCFEHALRMLSTYNPRGSGMFNDRVYPRLYCDLARGFCRYLLGLDSGVKRALFAYYSMETGELIR